MKAREVRKEIEKAGFKLISVRKHYKYRHPDGRTTMISKGNKVIPKPTLKQIEKQTGLKLT